MIRTIFLIVFSLCQFVASGVAATEEQRQALELLNIALSCRPPAQDDGESKSISHLRYVGDEDTLILEEDVLSIWKPPTVTTTAGTEVHRVVRYGARYADLDAVIKVTDNGLFVNCANDRLCSSEVLVLQESCESWRDGKKRCDSSKESSLSNRANGSSAIGLSSYCLSQLDNLKLAFRTLRAAAIAAVSAKHVVRSSFKSAALEIYERPDIAAKVIGGIGKDTGPIELTNCTATPRSWCQIKWGADVGWVEKANFIEMKRR